jgi:hypothetical protein
VPLVVIAGKEYGTGSSRDWAAKGPRLLGVAPSSPRATSASTAPTSSAWASCRCSSARARATRVARPDRPRDVRHRRPRAALDADVQDRVVTVRARGRRRRHHGVPGTGAPRHAAGARVLPARRHPAVRAAAAAGHGVTPEPVRRSSMREGPRRMCVAALTPSSALLSDPPRNARSSQPRASTGHSPLDALAAHAPHAVVQVDRHAHVVRHDAHAVADARPPVVPDRSSRPCSSDMRLHHDVRPVEQRAEARPSVPRSSSRNSAFEPASTTAWPAPRC